MQILGNVAVPFSGRGGECVREQEQGMHIAYAVLSSELEQHF